MNHLTKEQARELNLQLLEEKISLERRFDHNENHGLSISFYQNTGELSMYDNHPGDIGSELFERSKDLALNEQMEFQLEQVDEALVRMQQENYGTCVFCHESIPYERLQAVPTTLYCIKHVPDPAESERRPVEEEVLSPPFGRTSLDELDDQNQFDGEDAWQIVENWGNSDSPAMSENRQVEDYEDVSIESDELDGYVESYESFVATDLYGQTVSIVRNKAYRNYLHNGEGEPLLEETD
ncbi:TraR/DksA C4-type zinc finger protein [Paenibacillus sp. GP183]|uniref:TraR/DksA C4-type zinc finger protein n=1 Tax=Paenibacillus sp. GP183 TaxID=1882751 RepID=UPI000898A5B4|nr:TraR/DksA C4-type zinc finger protein [Paenibacillus sp. GP183]SEB42066.1 transcriptional regulator, TraR/DksA family [Paenibacillus sp. GP183]